MRRAIRKGVDKSRGHCFYPVVPIQGSPNVFVNGIPLVRAGDAYPTHCCGTACHAGKATSTSNVIVNFKPAHRFGDPLTCGDHASHGSPNVFIN